MFMAVTAARKGAGRFAVAGRVVLAMLFVLGGVLLWPGRFYVEKMLTDLALPMGVVWFALLLTIGWLWWRRRLFESLPVVFIWLLLTVAANHTTAGLLSESLEAPYLGIDPLAEGHFDVICLLGGGAKVNRQGRATLGNSGSRLIVAAELFRAGRAPRILCTGEDLQSAPNLPTVAQTSKQVLMSLGTPPDGIITGGGYNTKTEMQAIAALAEERNWQRLGLVTSAWHLPRAMRLGLAAGIENDGRELIPLPADFRTEQERDLPWIVDVKRFSLVPSAGALGLTHASIKEYLASLVGR